jgi:hypothetical protein
MVQQMVVKVQHKRGVRELVLDMNVRMKLNDQQLEMVPVIMMAHVIMYVLH